MKPSSVTGFTYSKIMSTPTLRKKISFDPALDSDGKTDSKNVYVTKRSSSSKGLIGKIFKSIVVLLFVNLLGSYFLTETWTWGYKNQYTNWRNWVPRQEKIFTLEELAKHDGTDPHLPIYLAINGEVFDVTAGGSHYGKGGSYGFFSGKDASRAYVTGCFQTHLTHDLRGLTKEQIKDLEGWADFYRNHHTYHKVGRVMLTPIDPNSPIPEPCKDASQPKS
ncbi:hypothetical protein G9A89_006893 [Geosiphon pyriformis]|nr:hypothetical protein G9A89_006893 [Geosiphon pyriformis]